MSKNLLKTANETYAVLGKLNSRLDETLAKLVAISKEARGVKLGGGGTSKSTAASTKARNVAEEKLNAVLKEQHAIRERAIKQLAKAELSQSRYNKFLERQKVETRLANQANREAAIEVSNLAGAHAKLINKRNIARRSLRDLINTQGASRAEIKKAQREYDILEKKVQKANAATRSFAKGGLNEMVRGIKNLIGAFGIVGGATLFASLSRQVFNLTKTLDGLQFAMKKIIPVQMELTQTTAFLKRITNDYGTDIVATTERYIKFLAAAKQSGLTLRETEKIFGTVTKASGVLGLKTDELTGVYLALEQMLSKGKVTTEELRRQLGERLPGAFGIMAEALDVSLPKLDEMLKKGEVLSHQALPLFAEKLEEAYGIESVKKVDTLVAAHARLKNVWVEYVNELNAADAIKGVLNFLARNLKQVVDWTFRLVRATLVYKATVIATRLAVQAYTIAKIAFTAVTKGATAAMAAFNTVTKLSPLAAIATILGVAAAAFVDYTREVNDAAAAMKRLQEQSDKATLAIIDNTMAQVESALAGVEKEVGAEKEKVDKKLGLLDQYTKDVEEGTHNLYDTQETIIEQREDDITKTLAEKQANNKKLLEDYYKALREDASTPFPTLETFTQEESNLAGDQGSTRTKAQEEILRRLNEMRENVLKRRNQIQKEADDKLADQAKKDAFALAKFRLEAEAGAIKKVIDDENAGLEERLIAVEAYQNNREDLIELQEEYETDAAQGREDAITRIEEEAHKKRNDAQEEAGNIARDVINSDFEKRLKSFDTFLNNEAYAQEQNLKEVIQALRDKGYTEEQIEDEITRMRRKHLRQRLKDQLEFLKAQLEASNLNADQQQKLRDQIAALDQQIMSLGSDGVSKKWLDDLQTARDIVQGITDVTNAMFDNRIQGYQDDIERNRDYYAELLANEELTEEERDALEARRDLKERQIEKKKRDAERRKAIANKAFSAAQVIINTAESISKTLADGGAFLGIPLVPIVAALGAAQLATVFATPIPQYEHGKGEFDRYEGPAIWGEKRREAKFKKDGSIEISPKRPGNHLTHVDKDDIIHPDADRLFRQWNQTEVAAKSYEFTRNSTADYLNLNDRMLDGLDRQTERFVNEIRKKKMSFTLNQSLDMGEHLDFLARKQDTL